LQPFTFTEQSLAKLEGLDTSASQASRLSVAQILQVLMQDGGKIVIGSADLSGSVGVINSFTRPISKEDFSGNFIHYGVREHAMAAIMNGLALSGFLPIGGTFLVFSDYMRPAIRLASLMELAPIYIMTHDSIGLGEDGPTHQPVEHLASLRCMPNLNVYRPADFVESVGTFLHIAKNHNQPSLISLSRQTINNTGLTKAGEVSKGAYFLIKHDAPKEDKITIFATGSEVSMAAEVVAKLAQQGITADLVSVPCVELFWLQEKSYINTMLNNSKFKVAIEAAASFGWHSIIGENGLFCGVSTFGKSAPASDVYNYFKLNATDITQTILTAYENRN
jgi:transketolase